MKLYDARHFIGAWRCQECGKKFPSARRAELASDEGCPRCGSTDIDFSGPVEQPEAWPVLEEAA